MVIVEMCNKSPSDTGRYPCLTRVKDSVLKSPLSGILASDELGNELIVNGDAVLRLLAEGPFLILIYPFFH